MEIQWNCGNNHFPWSRFRKHPLETQHLHIDGHQLSRKWLTFSKWISWAFQGFSSRKIPQPGRNHPLSWKKELKKIEDLYLLGFLIFIFSFVIGAHLGPLPPPKLPSFNCFSQRRPREQELLLPKCARRLIGWWNTGNAEKRLPGWSLV